MAFNINEFKHRGLVHGGARPSQFKVMIFPPDSSSPASAQFQFLCTAASLPSFIVEPVQAAYFGRTIKFAGDRVFQDWQVEILNDADFGLRGLLEKWSNDINALISNRMNPALWATEYKRTAEVYQYGMDGSIIRAYRFDGLFPTQVDAIGLSWAASNQIESFNTNFAYDYFEPIEQGMAADVYSPILSDDAVSGTIIDQG